MRAGAGGVIRPTVCYVGAVAIASILRALVVAALGAAVFVGCDGDSPEPAPTPTITADPVGSATSTVTPTPQPTAAGTPTLAPIVTPSPTPSPAVRATPAPPPTPSPTPDAAVEATPVPFLEPTRPALRTSFSYDATPGVYTAITVGASHACALTADGEAVCWDIASGAVWDAPPGPYTGITARRGATCAITEAGEIACWSAVGEPFPEDEPDPSRDAPPGRYTAFSWDVKYATDRYTHACALTDGSELVCWSQEGSRASPEELVLPDPPPGAYTALSVRYAFLGWGQDHLALCALMSTDGAVCWGAGSAHATLSPQTTRVLEGRYTSVGVSRRSFCGLTVAGEIEGCGAARG